jgi:hypothetical protein
MAYVNTLQNPFVFDDRTEILENHSIVDVSQISVVLRHSITRPLTNLSYAIDYAGWGLNPVGYHLTNLLLHVANVLLLFALVRGLAADALKGDRLRFAGAPVLLAFATASLFAVHPVLTEGVGYVSSRAELLAGVFVFTSFVCLRRALASLSMWWAATGFGAFLLALGAKEIAVAVPLIVAAYDWLLRSNDRSRRSLRFWRIHAPLLGVLVVGGVVRVWLYITVEHPTAAGLSWSNALLNVPTTARYLALLAVPTGQSIVHQIDPLTAGASVRLLGSLVVLATLAAIAWRVRNRQPLVTFGALWFVLFLSPSAALIVLAAKGQPFAEHRVYLASCGFFLALTAACAPWVADTVSTSPARIRLAGAAFVSLLAVLLTLTVSRNRVWADPVALWADATRKAPRVWMSHVGLGEALYLVGDCESATNEFRRAILLRPTELPAYVDLATCLRDSGDSAAAERVLRLAIAQTPAGPDAPLALAALEEERLNSAEALRLCQLASRFPERRAEAAACVDRNARSIQGRGVQ